MKNFNRIPFGYILSVVFVVSLIFARFLNVEFGERMADKFYSFSSEMVLLVPCIFLLIGLLDVWIPQQWIQKHVGEESGFRGAVLVVLLAMFQGVPLYGAIATAHLLWKKGCSLRNVFMYLGAYSTLKVPMLLFEVSFLGWKFTLVRSAVALPVFILIAEIMAAYARRAGLQLKQFEDDVENGQPKGETDSKGLLLLNGGCKANRDRTPHH